MISEWPKRITSPSANCHSCTGAVVVAFTLVGVLLDVALGERLFTFHNSGATLEVFVPGLNGAQLPVEEFVFYVTSCTFVLSLYLVSDCFLFRVLFKPFPPGSLLPSVAGVMAAVTPLVLLLLLVSYCCRAVLSGDWLGLPEYMWFITAFGFGPAAASYPFACHSVNRQALAFTTVTTLLISVIWEVTLGVPYEWWGYHPQRMMGIFIKPWHNLPVEAVVVWFMVSFAVVLSYEALHTLRAQGPSSRCRAALIGMPPGCRPLTDGDKHSQDADLNG